MKLSEGSFVRDHGDDPWLAICLPRGEGAMVAALRASSGADLAGAKPPEKIEFHTRLATAATMRSQPDKQASSRKEPDLPQLLKLVGGGCYFSALRKRLDGEGALGDRVSVGRAMNKDIVLRHASISKLHAYFESTGPGAWSVTDAGSKNGTSVEGTRLAPRESRGVANGDQVTFGSIDTLFLHARTVWRLVHGM